MKETLQHFLTFPSYGIVVEYAGLILLKHGYTRKPIIFKPEIERIPSLALDDYNKTLSSSSIIYATNSINGQTMGMALYDFTTRRVQHNLVR